MEQNTHNIRAVIDLKTATIAEFKRAKIDLEQEIAKLLTDFSDNWGIVGQIHVVLGVVPDYEKGGKSWNRKVLISVEI